MFSAYGPSSCIGRDPPEPFRHQPHHFDGKERCFLHEKLELLLVNGD